MGAALGWSSEHPNNSKIFFYTVCLLPVSVPHSVIGDKQRKPHSIMFHFTYICNRLFNYSVLLCMKVPISFLCGAVVLIFIT